MSACPACLRRSALIGFLAAPIAALLDSRRAVPAVLALPDEELIAVVGRAWRDRAVEAMKSFDATAARLAVEDAGLFAICLHDDAYPPSLMELDDAPAVLYGAGSQGRLEELVAEPAVALVGARRASSYGLEVARDIARGLSAARVTVVSGLALGVDAAAHRGALAAGGHTVAVLACGAERAYPRTNRALYRRVTECGVVIGELPPGTPPRRWTFPARNRIMAGLAQVTIVVEAAERSGSLITARFAGDLGREVGAVPGRVTARMAAGSNRLLYDGAQLVRGPADVLDMLFGAGGWSGRGAPDGDGAGAPDGDGAAAPDPARRPARLDPSLRRVLDVVEGGGGAESAADATGLTTAEVRAALGRLELLGLVRRDSLGTYERSVAG